MIFEILASIVLLVFYCLFFFIDILVLIGVNVFVVVNAIKHAKKNKKYTRLVFAAILLLLSSTTMFVVMENRESPPEIGTSE